MIAPWVPEACRRIIDQTAAYFDVPADHLTGRSRRNHVVRARHVAMYLCRTQTGLSYPVIGEIFHRDHTTVMHGYNRADRDAAANVLGALGRAS